MEFCSDIIRNVEIPSSLPPLSEMTRIEGSIILKDAVADSGNLRVEGDLLWQGYFIRNDGIEECLWEGAEYFLENLSIPNLQIRESFMIEPTVLQISGENVSEDSCAIKFSVRWWDKEDNISVEQEDFTKDLTELEENFRDTVQSFKEGYKEDNLDLLPIDIEPKEEVILEAPPEKRESKITEICNDFRELRKKQEEREEESVPEPAKENSMFSQCAPYRLHYYRAKEGDSLETIADRFSVSLSRMRTINELDEVGSIHGRMIRIPGQS